MAYTDANRIEHADYRAACEYYGADHPDDVRGEQAYFEAEFRASFIGPMEPDDVAIARLEAAYWEGLLK